MDGMGGSAGRDPLENAPDRTQEWDFFISYASGDVEWAEWIAWQLEEAGYRVLLKAWDVTFGNNWMEIMQQGMTRAKRTIALLSAAYLGSASSQPQWQAAVLADPQGVDRKLAPIRIEDCDRPGFFAQITSIDLFGLDEDTAREKLLEKIKSLLDGRAKPAAPPLFPHASRENAPAFPSPSSPRDERARRLAVERRQKVDRK
ncbi:toll/interleukin-1 receptor domain-containing protein, partial [Frankia sp. CiP1_Cm_nod2]|uniref:toll/interleukin-1 receptor domain-containing protein n=1 Tax=Frankia sp. CiP1_Cm_nod2 TaxID=2897161 RepID=UPI0020256321